MNPTRSGPNYLDIARAWASPGDVLAAACCTSILTSPGARGCGAFCRGAALSRRHAQIHQQSRFAAPYLHGAWARASASNKMATTCIRCIHADTRAGRCAACLLNTALHARWVVGAVASQVEATRRAARGRLAGPRSILRLAVNASVGTGADRDEIQEWSMLSRLRGQSGYREKSPPRNWRERPTQE